jgi:cysteinyl-tRNA synthetase
MKGEKMSKSLGNVYGLADAIDTYGPRVVRFYYLNAHYRSPLDFQPGRSLKEAAEAYRTLTLVADRLRAAVEPQREGVELSEELATAAADAVEGLDEALANDLNTREAIATLFGWASRVQPELDRIDALAPEAVAALAAPFDWANEVLGLCGSGATGGSEALDGAVRIALDARSRARTRGDYTEADRIRDALAAAGIVVEDRGPTTRWRLAATER